MRNRISDGEHERRTAEDIWLNYFNRYLRETGAISDKEFTRMTELIAARSRKQAPKRER